MQLLNIKLIFNFFHDKQSTFMRPRSTIVTSNKSAKSLRSDRINVKCLFYFSSTSESHRRHSLTLAECSMVTTTFVWALDTRSMAPPIPFTILPWNRNFNRNVTFVLKRKIKRHSNNNTQVAMAGQDNQLSSEQ